MNPIKNSMRRNLFTYFFIFTLFAPIHCQANALSFCYSLLQNTLRPFPRLRAHTSRFELRNIQNKLFGTPITNTEGYVSQNGQDRWLHENAFYNLRGGTFVDIGAHNGVDISNTFYFETHQGWNGLCVEPIPASFDTLKKSRKCSAVQGVVSKTLGPVSFDLVDLGSHVDNTMLSGLSEHYDSQHAERIAHSLSEVNGTRTQISVESYPMHHLLDEFRLFEINYLSIDTEGSELEILQTIPWERVKIWVLTVENNYATRAIPDYLIQQGYRLVYRIGRDDIFFRNDFVPSVR